MTQDIKLLSSEDHLSLFSLPCKRVAFCIRRKRSKWKIYLAGTYDACTTQLIYTAEAHFLQYAEISEMICIFNADTILFYAHMKLLMRIYTVRDV
jgi:hypothetical protein